MASNLEIKNVVEDWKFLILANIPDVTGAASVFAKEENESTETKFVEVLKRNLAAFGLELETGIGDGDCGFRSLAKQISKLSR